MRARKLTAVLAAVPLILASAAGIAHADILHNDVQSSAEAKTLTIATGGSTTVNYWIEQGGQGGMPGCDASDGSPVTVTPVTPAGVIANPTSLTFTACGSATSNTRSVVFSSSTPSTGHQITHTTQDQGGNYNVSPATFTLKVDAPVITNTAPEVSVTGVTDGGLYRVSETPQPACSVVDAEDSDESAEPQISNGAYDSIGSHTVTCSYTDKGDPALTGTATATYSVIRDLDVTPPVISKVVSGEQGSNGWYTGNVTLDWTVSEAESPETLETTGCDDVEITADQVATAYSCAASSEGGAAETQTVVIGRDTAAPAVSLLDGPAHEASYYFGSVPAAPTCGASDETSGLDGHCTVSGYSDAVGTHTVTASAKDNAGHTASVSRTYTVLPWALEGFYSPVDMGGVLNTVRAGSTVPLKFELFAGSSELTSTSDVASFKTSRISCTGLSAAEDAVEVTSTGGTSLRYDTTGGQFIQNWQTPKAPGTCYSVTMTARDGSSITALFKLK